MGFLGSLHTAALLGGLFGRAVAHLSDVQLVFEVFLLVRLVAIKGQLLGGGLVNETLPLVGLGPNELDVGSREALHGLRGLALPKSLLVRRVKLQRTV